MKTYATCFCLFLLLCFQSSAVGQSSCIVWGHYQCGDSHPPAVTCINTVICQYICALRSNSCAPPNAANETCPTCNGGKAGAPISLATGDTFIEQTDIRVPGLNGGLSLVRTWNSKWPATQAGSQVGLFGPNWRSNFEERVFVGSDAYIKYARGDGSFWSFGVGGAQWSVAAPTNAGATLAQNSTNWIITFKTGEKRLFDNTTGNLTAIIDRNGNTTQLTYDSLIRLVAVTDPASRHLYFSYQNSTSLLVTGVTSDIGLATSYTYDSHGRLLQVTKPDQSTLSFEYDGQSLITAVKDSNGKILEAHTYDNQQRGLTSSKANGIDALSILYPPPPTPPKISTMSRLVHPPPPRQPSPA